jgi:hypothetical protein
MENMGKPERHGLARKFGNLMEERVFVERIVHIYDLLKASDFGVF